MPGSGDYISFEDGYSDSRLGRQEVFGVYKLIAAFLSSITVVGILVFCNLTNPGEWPSQRKAMYSGVSNGEFVIFGGRGRNGAVMDDVWTYSNKRWSRFFKTDENGNEIWPSGRFNGCFLTTSNDELLLFGGDRQFYGLNKPNFTAMSNEAWTWNTDTGWSLKYPIEPEPNGSPFVLKRSAPACGYVADEKKMYVLGGRNAEDMITNMLWEIDFTAQEARKIRPHRFTPDSEFPLPMKGSCAVSPSAFHGSLQYQADGFATIMLLQGGRKGNQYTNALYELAYGNETDQFRWRLMNPPDGVTPERRNHHGCTYSPGQMWIFGGRSNHRQGKLGLLDSLWNYNITAGRWNRIPKSRHWPLPRFLPSIQFIKETGQFIIFGGQTDRGKYNDIWMLNGDKLVQESPCMGCHLKKKKYWTRLSSSALKARRRVTEDD